MSYDEKKLATFRDLILKNAEEKAKQIENEALVFREKELKNIDKKINVEFVENVNNKIENLKSKYKYKISKQSFENKKEILEQRNNLIENMFEICKKTIKNFTTTKEYEQYLINKISRYFDSNVSYKLTVKISKSDLKLEKEILGISSLVEVKADSSIVLGGFKVVDLKKSIEIDETFDSALEDLSSEFFKTSKLNLKNF